MLLVLAFSWTCCGALIAEVHNAQIFYGGSGYVDMLISSDGSDNLAAFSAQLKITQTLQLSVTDMQNLMTFKHRMSLRRSVVFW